MEIAKAVSYQSKIVIMDEPTSSLTENEVEHLFEVINGLREKGVAVIYITHRIQEIFRISDEISVMRDGMNVGTWRTSELSKENVISKMVGREISQVYPKRTGKPGEVVLRIEELSSPFAKSFKGVSFELHEGEILGIGGLVGAQRTEMVEAIFGLRSVSSGSISIKGKRVRINTPINAKKNGIALLTEERRTTGIIPMLPVLENIVIANQAKYSKKLFLNEKLRRKDAKESIERLRIRTPSLKTLIQFLSGGNQQKVLLAKWLLTLPDILILDEPTRGIDVGSKFEIYKIMANLASQGKSIIMISSELPELIGMSDRIMVMCEGRLAGFTGNNPQEEEIMKLATQFV